MKYTTILFDWDGCLFNNLPTWLDIYAKTLGQYGIKIENKDISQKLFGDWNGPLKVGLPESKLEEFNKELLLMADKLLPTSPLHLGARELLTKLVKSDIQLGLVTSSKLKTVEPMLRKHDLYDLFRVIVTADMVKEHKPHPESIYKAMGKLDSENTSTVIIGDSEKDVLAAHNAEIDSILYLPEIHSEIYNFDELKKTNPTHIVNTLSQILDVIK